MKEQIIQDMAAKHFDQIIDACGLEGWSGFDPGRHVALEHSLGGGRIDIVVNLDGKVAVVEVKAGTATNLAVEQVCLYREYWKAEFREQPQAIVKLPRAIVVAQGFSSDAFTQAHESDVSLIECNFSKRPVFFMANPTEPERDAAAPQRLEKRSPFVTISAFREALGPDRALTSAFDGIVSGFLSESDVAKQSWLWVNAKSGNIMVRYKGKTVAYVWTSMKHEGCLEVRYRNAKDKVGTYSKIFRSTGDDEVKKFRDDVKKAMAARMGEIDSELKSDLPDDAIWPENTGQR